MLLQSPEPTLLLDNLTGRVEGNGDFSVGRVPAGRYYFRTSGLSRTWAIRSVTVNGIDVTDTPIEIAAGRAPASVKIVVTDLTTAIRGTVMDGNSQPAPFATVVAFSDDPAEWGPVSRRLQSAQPDQSGAFELRGLPAGSYFLIATDDVERGEWLNPAFLDEIRPFAQRIAIADGETKAQDLKLKSRY